MSVTLTPAYGRDYRNMKDAIKDFDDGKDFIMISLQYGHGYVNKDQLIALGVDEVSLRYKRQTQQTIVQLPRKPTPVLRDEDFNDSNIAEQNRRERK